MDSRKTSQNPGIVNGSVEVMIVENEFQPESIPVLKEIQTQGKAELERMIAESLKIVEDYRQDEGTLVEQLLNQADFLFLAVQANILEIGFIFYFLDKQRIWSRLDPTARSFQDWLTNTIGERIRGNIPTLIHWDKVQEAMRLYKLFRGCIDTSLPTGFLLNQSLSKHRMARLEEQVSTLRNGIEKLDEQYNLNRVPDLDRKAELEAEKQRKLLRQNHAVFNEVKAILSLPESALKRDSAQAASLSNEMEPLVIAPTQVSINKGMVEYTTHGSFPLTRANLYALKQMLSAKNSKVQVQYVIRGIDPHEPITIDDWIEYCTANNLFVKPPEDEEEGKDEK